MKKLNLFCKTMILVMCFVFAATFLVACGKHKHTLGDWERNETHHWKICSDCGQQVDKAEHQYQFTNGACLICGKEQPVDGSHGLTYSHTYDAYSQPACMVTGLGTCEDAIITIPAEYQGMPVVAIGSRAFASETVFFGGADPITKIVIPSSITEIAGYAFKNRCSEIEFVNPTITEICDYAFNGYMGTTAPIPSTVLTIGEYAYANNGRRTSIIIPKSVVRIGDGAFSLSSNLETAIFEDGTQIQELPKDLFNGCEKLKAFEVPASVKRLINDELDGISAFKGVEGVITFEENSQLEYIGERFFHMFKGTIILPDEYTRINSQAFCGARGAKIVIPATVTEIWSGAFYREIGEEGPTIFFKGTAAQWENITKATNAVGKGVNIYMSNEWQMINGIPTINE